MPETTIATRALESGETTTEHAVMTSGVAWGRIYAIGGSLLAGLPAIIDFVKGSPVGETKWGQIVLTVLGGLVAIFGIVQETKSKVEYIQGRSLIKAAAVRDISADTGTGTGTGT